MKSKFMKFFTKKRILAICEAVVALAIFFTFFVPSVMYRTVNGHSSYYFNGFEAYLGKDEAFSASVGGVFYVIFLGIFIILCVSKMFVHPTSLKKLNILAIITMVAALLLIVHAPTACMLNTTKRLNAMHYWVGAWIQIGLTAALGAFVAVDQWAL